MDNRAIGVFDSGLGGLTVAREIVQKLPGESLIYLGDTARVPYGTRSSEVITKFALEMVNFLLKKKVKFLVVACNTISSTCLEVIQKASPVPVLGVIEPAVEEAVANSVTLGVGVIGTRATINSGLYEQRIKKLNSKATVLTQACPLFVPLAEEGFFGHPVTELVAREYLEKFTSSKVDTLILGCTHYPLLSTLISKVLGSKITLVDCAKPTSRRLKQLLRERKMQSASKKANYQFFVTDDPERVLRVAEQFWGKCLPGQLKKVTLD